MSWKQRLAEWYRRTTYNAELEAELNELRRQLGLPIPEPVTGAQPNTLYRFYAADGALLYVGITDLLPRRLNQHNVGKAWWFDVATVKAEHFPTRAAVLEAERRAIQTEQPRHNIAHNRRAT